MPVFRKGSFKVDLTFIQIGGEFDEQDRQCAWELYCEIVTRVAVRGSLDSEGNDVFYGEVYTESLDSLYKFFLESREIMKRYPVGAIGVATDNHLGFFIVQMLEVVIRPFLEKWHTPLRHFWSQADDKEPPFKRQLGFPHREKLEREWAEVRDFCRQTAGELARAYKLVDVSAAIPDEFRQVLTDERRAAKELEA